MKCPYCGKEMKLGYIQSPRPISWLPQQLKWFTKSGFTENGAIILSEGKLFSAPCVFAYNCSTCKAVIIDYKNRNCDFYSQNCENKTSGNHNG